MIHSAFRRVSGKLMRDQRGVAALEFAVIGGLMVTLMLGAFDFGNAAQEQIALQQAVRSGGEYAVNFPAAPASAIQTAVSTAVANAGLTLSAAPSVACSCDGAEYACGSPPSNCPAPVDVAVSATAPFVSVGAIPIGISSNTANYVVRIR